MAELLIAVVRKPFVEPVIDALVTDGHRVTGLKSVGGLLKEESQTLLLAVDEDRRQAVLDIFARLCAAEDVDVPPFVRQRLVDWRATRVRHAGATIMIVPITEIVRT